MRLIKEILLRKCLKLLETPKVIYTTTQSEMIIVKVKKYINFIKLMLYLCIQIRITKKII